LGQPELYPRGNLSTTPTRSPTATLKLQLLCRNLIETGEFSFLKHSWVPDRHYPMTGEDIKKSLRDIRTLSDEILDKLPDTRTAGDLHAWLSTISEESVAATNTISSLEKLKFEAYQFTGEKTPDDPKMQLNLAEHQRAKMTSCLSKIATYFGFADVTSYFDPQISIYQ
jgi:hypothetical protein